MTKTSTTPPRALVIEETNLSRAWIILFQAALSSPTKKISPVILSLTGFGDDGQPEEDSMLRSAIDEALRSSGKMDIETVAYTIFPQRLWKLAKGDRKRLFHLYARAFPHYQRLRKRDNRRGLYFERLTMFGPDVPEDGNQLEWILSKYTTHPSSRRSMFQAAIFDPRSDHVHDARLGFPCLQHISFVPTDDGLVMNAFYATQYVFEKAYGNYLGLAQLGAFMAGEMGLRFARLNVTIGVANFTPKKSDPHLQPLLKLFEKPAETGT